jgi:beta-galactosidase
MVMQLKNIDFNEGWKYRNLKDTVHIPVILPHDAMLKEGRSVQSLGGSNISYFHGGDYEYIKDFEVSKEFIDQVVFFEFEGIYKDAFIYINDQLVGSRPYGYTHFYVDATNHLLINQKNELKVLVYNSDQPNSRWYTGSGIYRPVKMIIGDKQHVVLNGVQIKTIDIQSSIIEVSVTTNQSGILLLEIMDDSNLIYSKTMETSGQLTTQIQLSDVVLWSPESPKLYTLKTTFGQDITHTKFGIRLIEWNAFDGFRINKNRVILKGACIHHDNGLLGAISHKDAEKRKVRLLLNQGYNAIRSAHNPCSKSLLDACDELGMLVMDEYVDMWYIHKTKYDYANHFSNWWRQDLMDMVNKDINHPSVIMYSIGNEVSETAQKKGIHLVEEMTQYLHHLDSSRPVTCGVNIFFNYLSSIGLGVYSDKKAKKSSTQSVQKKVGSEFFNDLAGIFGAKFMKFGATLRGSDQRTKEAFKRMDIAGYNYGILRYQKDLKKYPNRLILGTETFCTDASKFMRLAKENNRIVGDFVWAGMDYLGESGIGSWVYQDDAPDFSSKATWLTAGSGRLDIFGKPSGEAYYTQVALEKIIGPKIAVKPVYQTGKHSPSAWKMTDALPSWTWPGCEGMKAHIEVYANGYEVELLINDVSKGKKKISQDQRVTFNEKYQRGTIQAVLYDAQGHEIGRDILHTASSETKLTVTLEQSVIHTNGLLYVHFSYTDAKGILKPMEKHQIHIEVENGVLLGFGHACPYNPDGYLNDTSKTYYGESMAVLTVHDHTYKELTFTISDESTSQTVHVPIV